MRRFLTDVVNPAPRIFLVGPMGAGKSTVGRALAAELAASFYDSDREIELRAGADIPWIFEIEGESGFREREHRILSSLCEEAPAVIATGGGAVVTEANRMLMATSGFVVYLEATVKEQVRRTKKDEKRPLLAGKNRQEVLAELMKTREPLYLEVADLVLPTAGRNARELAQEIMEALPA
jgi:shikimate kinase